MRSPSYRFTAIRLRIPVGVEPVGTEPTWVDTLRERRRKNRFPVQLPVAYVIWEDRLPLHVANTTTCDLSSIALSFRSREDLPVGAHITLVVEWPVKHNGIYPIDLMASGIVIRSGEGRTAVGMNSTELRVRSSSRKQS